ncbi:hypothetical protein CPB83DRAFT_779631 [Crepidotus variabilis]|uniref:Uncharacterized protein n=1 Tax=Crepidotus variabilis TaxID=179855 RepID=A0A9P6JWW4_9AGAR|nr:hypothetical protein CPB83DRAFT_779631 [Crepidotus variabilis]
MKFFSSVFVLSATAVSVFSAPGVPNVRRDVDPGLIPEFGHAAGLNPTGTGDCDGVTNAAGVVVKVPCFCPPDRAQFIQQLNANVKAGRAVNNPSVAVTFQTGDDKASKLTRIGAALVTLQNMRGPGVGCPAASTTFVAQQKAIQDGTDGAAPAPAAPAPAPPAAPAPAAPVPAPPAAPAPAAPSTGDFDESLVPQFGLQSGLNPTGTGDCDGIKNAAGVTVKVPCACPPDRASFIQSLRANAAVGHAVNNPTVQLSFPNGDDKQSKLARIGAALVTLQNLHGAGVGCPAASTTFSAQQKAIQDGP